MAYNPRTKNTYFDSARAQLTDLQRRIRQMQSGLVNPRTVDQRNRLKQLQELNRDLDNIWAQLLEIKATPDETWQAQRMVVDQALKTIAKAL